MGLEKERKFLVTEDSYKQFAFKSIEIKQGYLNREPERTVRVRTCNDKGYITVKGKNEGILRLEFEYEIPFRDAEAILGLCKTPIIEKTRYLIKNGDYTWEIDEFHGSKEGLTVAEIELPSIDAIFDKPYFIGEEVTGDVRYYNSNL